MKNEPHNVINYIALKLKISKEHLSVLYHNDNDMKLFLDEILDDINERRVENGLDRVIIPHFNLVD